MATNKERSVENKLHKNNSSVIESQILMMSLSGIWPKSHMTNWYKLRCGIGFFSGIALTITMLIETYQSIPDFIRLSEILYMASTMISYIVKLYGFKLKTPKVFKLLKQIQMFDKDLEKSLEFDYLNYIEKAWWISTGLTNIYRFICVICGITYFIFPIIQNQSLPFPFPYFNEGPYHYPMYMFQWVSIMFSCWNNTSLDVITTGFMLIAGLQLDLLREKITHTLNKKTAVVERELKNICLHHLKIIQFVRTIEEIFAVGLLANFCSSIICICNTGFNLLLINWKSGQFLSVSMYFLAMFCQLSMYCWFGNELILKNAEVREACYNSLWYELNPKLLKYIFLVMERTKKPLTITAYKLASLSLVSFMSILNWSYSYFALLRKLYAKD